MIRLYFALPVATVYRLSTHILWIEWINLRRRYTFFSWQTLLNTETAADIHYWIVWNVYEKRWKFDSLL